MRLVILFFLLIIANHAKCSDIESCLSDASYKYNIAPEVIRAIIEIESGGNPLAINVAGKSYSPDNSEKALEIINENKSKSFDIGIMQVNKWWFDKFGYDYSYGLDTCFNIHLGSWILAYEISRHGYTWEAIGRYHSHTEKHKERYIKEISKLLLKRNKTD